VVLKLRNKMEMACCLQILNGHNNNNNSVFDLKYLPYKIIAVMSDGNFIAFLHLLWILFIALNGKRCILFFSL